MNHLIKASCRKSFVYPKYRSCGQALPVLLDLLERERKGAREINRMQWLEV